MRTLHHYDALGLLTPSARFDSGYRQYNRTDIARLHRIQALQSFGLSLAEIGDLLANKGIDLTLLIEQQLQKHLLDCSRIGNAVPFVSKMISRSIPESVC